MPCVSLRGSESNARKETNRHFPVGPQQSDGFLNHAQVQLSPQWQDEEQLLELADLPALGSCAGFEIEQADVNLSQLRKVEKLIDAELEKQAVGKPSGCGTPSEADWISERAAAYTRQPALLACKRDVRVEGLDRQLSETHLSLRVLETLQPPTLICPRGPGSIPAGAG